MLIEPENKRINHSLIYGIYFPWILATILGDYPVTSYWIAWAGSFLIFYLTWFSSAKFVLPDLPVYKQIMRPLFLQQAIFAGFMCCTSAFYFLDRMGYMYLEKITEVNFLQEKEGLSVIAYCQRLSLLAHAAMVTGVLWGQQKHLKSRPLYQPMDPRIKGDWLIPVCLITFVMSIAMELIPGLFQFSIGLYGVAIISGAVILVRGIRENKVFYSFLGGGVFIANLIHSTLTGYKEHILVNFIILACLLYPYYRRTVTAVGIPLFVVLFYVLPTYANTVRNQAWFGNATAEEARAIAFDAVLHADPEIVRENNWMFLTTRLSEIEMFKEFVSSTPREIPFYGFDIAKNALEMIIPRVLWPDKPITETLAMERVYNAGVIDVESNVSAKTRPVVDAYLSAGSLGVFIYMFLLGLLSQWLCNTSENLFAGYYTGCVIFYNGFFQILWRGETTEFMVNSAFWSFIMMLAVFRLLLWANYIQKV